MKYIKPIDPHIHLRDTGSLHFQYALKDAAQVGLCALLEMPNPKPNLINYETCGERQVKVLDWSYGLINHGINIGITNDIQQAAQALLMAQHRHCSVRADKTFYCESTGSMGVKDEDYQRRLWQLRAECGYRGVSIGHFEDEKRWTGAFDPANPITHSQRQNEESETVQVERQLRNAKDANFRGIFYIAHASSPHTIQFVSKNRWRFDFEIIVECTWHHMFLNHEDYAIHGNRVKMNPPLRSKASQELILEHVLLGNVDIIGTDHAPHNLTQKDSKNSPASGVPAIPFWPKGIELLAKLGVQRDRIDRMTFECANNIFGLGMLPNEIDCDYHPQSWEKYGYNPFSRIDK